MLALTSRNPFHLESSGVGLLGSAGLVPQTQQKGRTHQITRLASVAVRFSRCAASRIAFFCWQDNGFATVFFCATLPVMGNVDGSIPAI